MEDDWGVLRSYCSCCPWLIYLSETHSHENFLHPGCFRFFNGGGFCDSPRRDRITAPVYREFGGRNFCAKWGAACSRRGDEPSADEKGKAGIQGCDRRGFYPPLRHAIRGVWKTLSNSFSGRSRSGISRGAVET